MGTIDPSEYQKRIDRITELFAGMVEHAEATAPFRCPYRDRHDRCTALFTCRNQTAISADPDALSCGHDGTFDYRDAWEAHPRGRDRMKTKLAAIRRQGEQRRSMPDPDSEAL